MNIVVLLVIAVVAFVVFFLPSIIAFRRGHPNRWPILLVNTVFGSTLIGWFICLIWSMNAIHRPLDRNLSAGGESGLNLFVNDPKTVYVAGFIPSPRESRGNLDTVSQLERLKALRDDGSITDAEYSRLKGDLLGRSQVIQL